MIDDIKEFMTMPHNNVGGDGSDRNTDKQSVVK